MSTVLYQTWNHRVIGTATIGWSDAAGPHSVSISSTTNGGRLSHIDLSAVDPEDRSGSTLDLEFHAFATELQSAMDAATSETVTVAFSTTTLAYTLTCTGGTFDITFNGDAGARMRRILGFTASQFGAGPHGSNMRPWYLWAAAIDGRARYDQPAMREGDIKRRFADGGQMYSVGPVRPVYQARWAHQFEAKADVHRRFADADTLASGASWTAQDFLDHAARHAAICVIKDSTESMVFYTGGGFDRSAVTRSRPDSDLHQIVSVNAESIIGWL